MKIGREPTLAQPAKPSLRVEVRVREAAYAPGDSGSSPGATESLVLRAAVLAIVVLVAGIYSWIHIGRGWVPADDGILSQSALRVVHGQLPHRDFDEIYTGGLSLLHALAFRAFGINLMSLRLCVFLFFLAWLPAVYYIVLRFTSALGAGAITLLAVAWSYPNYPAAMPSWYNLFFATFGAAALLRYLDVRTRRWLFLAGLCGGLSLLVKIIGAYYIAGVLLFLAFLEQSENQNAPCNSDAIISGKGSKSSWPYRIFSLGSLFLFLAVLFKVLGARLGVAEFYHFLLPSAAVVMLIALGERAVRVRTVQRFRTMFRALIPFLCGAAVPVILFLLPYARSGGVWRLLSGVTSSAVFHSAALGVNHPPGIDKILWVLPLLGVLAASMFWSKFQGKAAAALIGLGVLGLAVRATQSFEIASDIWFSVAALTPVSVLLGAVAIWAQGQPGQLTKVKRQQVMLLISLAATCSLVQFPFAAPIYLSYALPLTLLALVAIVSTSKTQPGTYVLASLVVLYLTFAVVDLVPRNIYELTHVIRHMETMHEPRAGGLQIENAAVFDDLSHFLREHSPNGLIFAGNECPELLFLSGLTNVTRDDGGEPPEELLKAIHSDSLNVVVLNNVPYFPTAAIRPDVRAEVMNTFPHSKTFGIFQVFWKR
ncbi:MAG: hypothetical protein WAK29_19840 [Terriglobales bacterium]